MPTGTPIEPVVGAISSVSRAAVRKVHQDVPATATAYLSRSLARWLLMGGPAAATARIYEGCVYRYISLDGGSGPVDLDVGLKMNPISFGPNDSVRALAHVVRDLGNGQRGARVLFWDELRFKTASAEMVALPVVERIDGVYGAGSTAVVEVWQLAEQQEFTVLPSAAQARRSDVQQLLARL